MKSGAHKKAVQTGVSPGSNLGTDVSSGKRLPSEGNAEECPPHAFSLFLNHPAHKCWFGESGLEPFFPTEGGEVSYNRLEGDSVQEERAEKDSEAVNREPSSVPSFSSLQSHAGSPHACPEHGLLEGKPGCGPFRGCGKLTEFFLGKREMEGCPQLLR